ncbi:hypothetical protein IT407_01145 [Candidatus Uhrbacteria bacterium]|nr:hypothetical protein [Candidatus Uhrbacteria bacterium]
MMENLQVIYTLDPLVGTALPSLFLAGPTPRHPHVRSWRPQALRTIRSYREKLAIYYPEPRGSDSWNPDGVQHIRWEREALKRADAILFWMPRQLTNMPGFRSNTEWGFWTARNPDKLVLGYPKDAPGMRGMSDDAQYYGIPIAHSLSATVKLSLEKLFSVR